MKSPLLRWYLRDIVLAQTYTGYRQYVKDGRHLVLHYKTVNEILEVQSTQNLFLLQTFHNFSLACGRIMKIRTELLEEFWV